jgi:Outer membrane protein beta-barrel family/Carboxypeptidase regulatory-like domain
MNRFLLVLLATCCFLVTKAQKPTGNIKGIVMDTASKRGLSYSTISLVQAKDSSLISFMRADSSGGFQIKNIAKGNYLVSASYVGFVPVWVPINLKEGETVNLGVMAMTDVNSASAVTVNAKRAPVVMNNDTLEFNTENFKTQPNAVVEDLLKKLPGVVVDADGTVRVNGQKINRVLVNGKEFFTGDPKLATKNLDADAVDKVQVFDKKSDRAAFTGVDDGQSEKAINLKLKKDRNKSLFGKVAAGVGTDQRFDAQTNINKFNGDQQISLLGMANNTNRQGFSINDVLNFSGELSRGMRAGGGINIKIGGGDDNGLPISGLGQNQQGVAKTFAGGINFNDSWKKKTDVNGSFIASDVDLSTDRSTNRQNLLPGNSFDYVSNSNGQKRVQQQRANFSIDQKVDSFISFKITPQITLQQNDNNSSSQYVSTDAKGVRINDGSSESSTRSEATNWVTNAQYRQRLKKKGRTISSNLNWNDNTSTQTGALLNKNSFYVSGISLKDSITNQRNSRDAHSNSFGGNLIYTEPVGKKSLLEFSVFYNSSKGTSVRKAYDYNAATGKYDLLNKLQSNDFNNNFEYGGGGISWRSNQKKINYTLGTSLQTTSLVSTNNTNGNNIQQKFTDWLPSLNLQYKLNSTRNLSLNYNTSTQNPATSQLQPIIDVSDPLNTYTGNPNLKRTYVQNLSLNYFNANTFTQSNFFAFVSASKSDNAIVNSDIVQTNGARVSGPVNADGVYNLFANADMGFPIKKLKSRIDIGMGASYMNNISFINLAKNTIVNSSIGPNLSWSYGNDTKFDLRLSARLNFSNIEYALQPQLNSRYLQQIYGLETNNTLPWSVLLNNNFNYTINTGRADGYNLNLPLWNLSMAKSFLKNNRAEIKFSVFDLLNKNVGVSRNASQNYIDDSRYNVLQRYFMLTASYRLNKAGSTTTGARVVVRSLGN